MEVDICKECEFVEEKETVHCLHPPSFFCREGKNITRSTFYCKCPAAVNKVNGSRRECSKIRNSGIKCMWLRMQYEDQED